MRSESPIDGKCCDNQRLGSDCGLVKQYFIVSLLRLGRGCYRDNAAPVAILRKYFQLLHKRLSKK